MTAKALLDSVLDLIFPPRCLLCGEVIPLQRHCEGCAEDYLRLRFEGCDCDIGALEERAYDMLDGVCASFLYEDPVSNTVARFKFRGESWLARDMAAFIAADFRACFSAADCDVVVSVPASERKRDHAQRLAAQTARFLKLPCDNRALVKIKTTATQHELGSERLTNLKGAFAVKRAEAVRGKILLLIDDVSTSGSTLNECARTLKEAGAQKVYAAVFCTVRHRKG